MFRKEIFQIVIAFALVSLVNNCKHTRKRNKQSVTSSPHLKTTPNAHVIAFAFEIALHVRVITTCVCVGTCQLSLRSLHACKPA